jgi:hypothetical protein
MRVVVDSTTLRAHMHTHTHTHTHKHKHRRTRTRTDTGTGTGTSTGTDTRCVLLWRNAVDAAALIKMNRLSIKYNEHQQQRYNCSIL